MSLNKTKKITDLANKWTRRITGYAYTYKHEM